MHQVFRLAKGMVRKSLARDRSSECYVEAVSRSLALARVIASSPRRPFGYAGLCQYLRRLGA